ncbi:MAG TPA: sulfotransferase [Candidatus Methylomirabilis sp.]|nr:sulfotransferase [Candidatus Methylomirabilis sp.]
MIIGIFGTGRNGSSLISRLLDGLGDSYVHPVEECFAGAFNDLALRGEVSRLVLQNCTTKSLNGLERRVDAERLHTFFAGSIETLNRVYIERCRETASLEKPDIHALLPKQAYLPRELIEDYLSGLARHVRPDLPVHNYVFKTVETPYVADYARLIPRMRFIHIVRDPVAVCSSQKRSLLENKRLPASYLGYDWLTCMLAKRWLPHARYLVELKSDPAHILVRYEDLVAAPDHEIARIADRLTLSPPARATKQTVFGNLAMESWGFNPSKRGVETPTDVVANLQAVNRYEEILTNREIDLINSEAAPYLEQLGYEKRRSLGKATLIVQHIFPDKWESMHCKGARAWLRALVGMLYRRLHIIFF